MVLPYVREFSMKGRDNIDPYMRYETWRVLWTNDRNNSIASNCPVVDIERPLPLLPHVKKLTLDGCNFTILPRLETVQELYLRDTFLQKWPDAPNLRIFQISQPENLSKAEDIQGVRIITDDTTPNLRKLSIKNGYNITAIKDMKKLHFLELINFSLIYIHNIPTLKTLLMNKGTYILNKVGTKILMNSSDCVGEVSTAVNFDIRTKFDYKFPANLIRYNDLYNRKTVSITSVFALLRTSKTSYSIGSKLYDKYIWRKVFAYYTDIKEHCRLGHFVWPYSNT
jgi:hypothetical protein